MIDWTKPIRVRKTKAKAKVLCTNLENKYPVVVRYLKRYEDVDGIESVYTLTPDGKVLLDEKEPFVENIPEIIKGYLNIYKGYATGFHRTIEEAKKNEDKGIIARYKVCCFVGQFDE